MTQSAMSSNLDLKWELLSDSESDEWVLFPDEFAKGDVSGPLPKLPTCEIIEQTLNEIEDLAKKDDDYWLDEFRLFEEIQLLAPAEDFPQHDHLEIKSNQQPVCPNYGLFVPETQTQPFRNEDLFSPAYENAATFILSNENVLYFNTEPSLTATDAGPKSWEEKNINSQTRPVSAEDEVSVKMEILDAILPNKARELDQWDSDTNRSETSSDGSTSKLSTEEEKEDETDDPEWSPKSPVGRKCRSARFGRRGGSLEDKKLRKKEQNKNAATRYRQKKKAEVCNILREEETLKEKKLKLEEKVTDIQNEIRYLKGLMRELFKAKGIID